MQGAGAELDRLPGLQPDEVEQQGRGDTRVARVAGGEPCDPPRLGPFARPAPVYDRLDVDASVIQRGERVTGSAVAHRLGQLDRADVGEEGERRVDRPHAAERLELGERAEQLGFRLRVRIATGREARPRLLRRRVRLQRQWFRGGEDLEQEGERAR